MISMLGSQLLAEQIPVQNDVIKRAFKTYSLILNMKNILLTLVTMLCITLFYNWKICTFWLQHLFCPPATLIPLVTIILFWVLFTFICYLFIILEFTFKWNHIVFVFLCLTYFSMIPWRSVMSSQKARFHFFCGWVVFHCVYISHILWASLVAQLVKNSPAMQETWFDSWVISSPEEGVGYSLQYFWGSLVAQMVENLSATWETWVRSPGWEDPFKEAIATHSSILSWRVPMNRGAWLAAAHLVTKSWTKLSY